MNVTELLIAIVSHVSWPATVIILALMFRESLHSVFGRIESANSKYLKVTLRSREPLEKLSRAEGIADALKLPTAPDLKRSPRTEFEERFKQVAAMVRKEPGAALFDAWDLLMQLTAADIEKKTARQPPSDQIISEAAKLYEQGVVGLMALLQMIVEQQKSSPTVAMDKDFVLRFIKLTGRVTLSLSSIESASAGDTK